MLHVIATVELNPGTRAAFLAAFKQVVPKVHAEDGCIEYGATIDATGTGIDRQIPIGPDRVVIVEKWRDLAALKAHLVAPHMTGYRASVKDYVKATTLQLLVPA